MGGAMTTATRSLVEDTIAQLRRDAEDGGYHLNPDEDFVTLLVEGLLVNQERYGYRACPCRLANGVAAADLDLVCPCDYRDDDLNDFGACFCALYVSEAIARGEASAESIPDRRPVAGAAPAPPPATATLSALAYPVWRCKVCGYLCARNNPPGACPVCKAGKERFERFL